MANPDLKTASRNETATDFDVVVIGAGLAGLYMLHKLRQLGFTVQIFESGDAVGGTWHFNRYPGARCDVQSVEYSYSFSDEIQQEWEWTELFAPQVELEAYLNWVADRLDLRRDIQLSAKVESLSWDEASRTWTTETSAGHRVVSRFVAAATGSLSAPLKPDIEGLHSFDGPLLYTNRFPQDGFDFVGKRVGVIGTGSSGVQVITTIVDEVSALYVFQRSAAYLRPQINRTFKPGEFDALKADYASIRAREKASNGGVIFSGALQWHADPTKDILASTQEQRLKVIEELGWRAPFAWANLTKDLDANRLAADMYGELVRRVVEDPEIAEDLIPHYPMGCKRMIVGPGYYEAFNRKNVALVNLRKNPIKRITSAGVETEAGLVELEVLVLATGFDALTGALNRIDISGRGGVGLRDYWRDQGPISYLGVQVPGFPNFFTINGPGSPSVLVNVFLSAEQHVEWIAECLVYLREHSITTIEPTEQDAVEWMEQVRTAAVGDVKTAAGCNSWYLGANTPGKPRFFLPYSGGFPAYRQRCDEIAYSGYPGFVLR